MEEQLTKIQSDIAWLTYLVEKMAGQMDHLTQQNVEAQTPEQIRAEAMRNMADDGHGGLI
mgnify:CR=1 FL=1